MGPAGIWFVRGREMYCKDCKHWSPDNWDIRQKKEKGTEISAACCHHIQDLACDTGYETEGIETKSNFGCILFEIEE